MSRRAIPLNPNQERELVARAQRGDRTALGELLWGYHERIYRLCLRTVGRRDDAADLAQDTLLKAVDHAANFRGDSGFGTWLYRIAMNLCISHLRKRKLRDSASLDHQSANGEDRPMREMLIGREPGPEQSVETGEQVERLLAALDTLDPSMKGILALRDLEGLDYRQIGEVLGLPEGTVKSRLFRARLALRQAAESPSREPRRPEVRDG